MIFRLNLNHSIKRGLFLTISLFLCFVVNVNAQTFKSVDDSITLLEAEAANTSDQDMQVSLKSMVDLINTHYQELVAKSNSMKQVVIWTVLNEDQDMLLDADLVGQFGHATDITQVDLSDYPSADAMRNYLIDLLKQ